MGTEQQTRSGSWLQSPAGVITCAFLAITVFFLVAEYRAHFFGALPWLLLLACPLLHLLHDGHEHRDHKGNSETRSSSRQGGQS